MVRGLVSIIVPVYNTEKYLDECITSIINQSYSNIELILVDDGSTDNSAEICRKYAERDNRVKYFYQKNSGAAAARNLGLDKCNGEYIGFIDSDDYIDSDMYEILVSALVSNNVQVAQILSRRVTDDGVIINQELIDRTENLPPVFYSANEAIEHYIIGNHSLWSHVYLATLFEKVRIPEGMSGEDIAVVIPLYAQCEKIVKVNKYKYNYRYNSMSVTSTPLNQRKINLLYEYETQLEKYGYNELYRQVVMYSIGKALSGIINAMLLGGDTGFHRDEKYFRLKLKQYINEFEENCYISKGQIRKFHFYLKCRLLYKQLLKIKRKFFYQRVLYGEE